jgi:hypothetical protein
MRIFRRKHRNFGTIFALLFWFSLCCQREPSMAKDTQKQNLSAAYELLKQRTDIGKADTFEELGPSAVYKTSMVLWLMLFHPIAHVALAHELSSVAALPPEIGARWLSAFSPCLESRHKPSRTPG